MTYQNPESGRYGVGYDDAYLIAFLIVLFTGIRAATLEYFLVPLARICGVKKRKNVLRFGEQAYMMLCYVVFWSVGMVCFVIHLGTNSKFDC